MWFETEGKHKTIQQAIQQAKQDASEVAEIQDIQDGVQDSFPYSLLNLKLKRLWRAEKKIQEPWRPRTYPLP